MSEAVSIWLTDEQRALLRKSVRAKKDYSKPNPDLEHAVATLHNENPHAFWTPKTLRLRKFFHEPSRPIPLDSFVIPNR